MIFFIYGASGSGKSACCELLQQMLPQVAVYDFDSAEVPAGADTAWRQRTTEHWIRCALQHQQTGQDTLVSGGGIPGEALACPSAPLLEGIAYCLLDCGDVRRIDRLNRRNGAPIYTSMETLCWAAWLRMHAADPQWRQDVIQAAGEPGMLWERWSAWQRGDPRWQTRVLDTTELSVHEVAEAIAAWVRVNQPGEQSDNSTGLAAAQALAWKKMEEEAYPAGHRRMLKKVFRLPDGRTASYDVIDGGRVVATLALTEDNQVILAKQFRPGPERILWELPGGAVNAGESTEEAARRELLEETGYTGRFEFAGKTYHCAYSTVVQHFYVATGCQPVGFRQLDENEFIEVVEMPFEEFLEILKSGQLTDVDGAYTCLHYLGLL